MIKNEDRYFINSTTCAFMDNFAWPEHVKSYKKNDFGLYNMSGNVSEMLQDKGVAAGGSFRDPGYDIRIQSRKKYDHLAFDIGFRVLMEVLEK